jgi:hypothetical protein
VSAARACTLQGGGGRAHAAAPFVLARLGRVPCWFPHKCLRSHHVPRPPASPRQEELRKSQQGGGAGGGVGGGGRGPSSGPPPPLSAPTRAPLGLPASNAGAPPAAAAAGGGGRGAGAKRQRVESRGPVVPPEHEVMPTEDSIDLAALQQRFEALKEEVRGAAGERDPRAGTHVKHGGAARALPAPLPRSHHRAASGTPCLTRPSQCQINAFAADTGHSVAVFTIGGLLTDAPDTPADDLAAEAILKAASSDAHPRLKLSVLKYGSGGVAQQLVARSEIVKFVCARGTKALGELAGGE